MDIKFMAALHVKYKLLEKVRERAEDQAYTMIINCHDRRVVDINIFMATNIMFYSSVGQQDSQKIVVIS